MKSADGTYFHGLGRSARQIATSRFLRRLLKGGLYIAAVLLVPGALIGAPILWWLDRRRKASPPSAWKTCS